MFFKVILLIYSHNTSPATAQWLHTNLITFSIPRHKRRPRPSSVGTGPTPLCKGPNPIVRICEYHEKKLKNKRQVLGNDIIACLIILPTHKKVSIKSQCEISYFCVHMIWHIWFIAAGFAKQNVELLNFLFHLLLTYLHHILFGYLWLQSLWKWINNCAGFHLKLSCFMFFHTLNNFTLSSSLFICL